MLSLLVLAAVQDGIGRPQKPPAAADAFVLPVSVGFADTEEQMAQLALVARGYVIDELTQRRIDSQSLAQLDGYRRAFQLDFADYENWSEANFAKLARHFKTRLIIGMRLLEMKSEEGPPPDPRAPGGSLRTTAKIKVWVYDYKLGKYAIDGAETTHTRTSGRPGPSERQLKQEQLQAAGEAAVVALKPVLDKFPKPRKRTRP